MKMLRRLRAAVRKARQSRDELAMIRQEEWFNSHRAGTAEAPIAPTPRNQLR